LNIVQHSSLHLPLHVSFLSKICNKILATQSSINIIAVSIYFVSNFVIMCICDKRTLCFTSVSWERICSL